jgi:hypothetical protein
VTLTALPIEECLSWFQPNDYKIDYGIHLCAKNKDVPFAGVCFGDSGGLLFSFFTFQ